MISSREVHYQKMEKKTLSVCPLKSHSGALSSFPQTLLLNHIQLIPVGTT